MKVSNFIDLHAHIGPELLQRKYTAQTLWDSEKDKLAAIAIKNHMYATSPFIGKTKKPVFIGSIVLNNFVGGLNPDAIKAAAALSKNPIIVWFPTIHAKNFLQKSRYEIPVEWAEKGFRPRDSDTVIPVEVLTLDGELNTKTINVINTIKSVGAILATGHLSWRESAKIVEEAVRRGVEKIIITHPIYQLIDMPLVVQKNLTKNKGVYIEQSWSMYAIDKVPIQKIARQIKRVGSGKCIITSDTGQVNSPSPSAALREFMKNLKKQGISEEDIQIMGRRNPQNIIKRINRRNTQWHFKK